MRRFRPFSVATAALAAALLLAAGQTLLRLDGFDPLPPKKLPPGYEVRGSGYHVRNDQLDVVVEPLMLKDMPAYYEARGLKNPFYDIPPLMNYFFVRLRIENLSGKTTLEFLPTNVIFENSMAKDESRVYETFYGMEDGEARLDTLGKTLFLKPLFLPPGQWIERLLFFEYEEPIPTKRMSLVLANLALGKTRTDLVFPYRGRFIREKR